MDEREYQKKHALIEHYNAINGYENARQVCLEILQYRPSDEWALAWLAGAYYNLRDFDACVKTCMDALPHLKLPHLQGHIFFLLGSECSIRKEHAQAADYFQKAFEKRPYDGCYLANYALELAYLGQKDKAEALFKRAEEMEPQNFFVLKAKFIFLFDFRKDRRAEEELLDRMLPLSTVPNTMNWYLTLFYEKYNEPEKAYEYCVKAVLGSPQNQKTREKLGHLEQVLGLC